MADLSARMNRIIDDSTEKAAKVVNTYAKPKYIAAIIEIVISSIAIIGIQVVAMGFDFSKLAQPEFWARTLALTICIFLLYRAVINARYDKTASRDNVLEAKKEYDDLNKNKTLDLKDFLQEFNLNTKIGVYVGKINKRINRLERKKIKTYSAKKKMALTAKIDVLKQEIKPDRVREVIDIIHVKYYMVWYDDFQDVERVGGNGKLNTRGNQSYKRNFNKFSLWSIWSYFICAIVLSMSFWTFGETSTITIIANVLSSSIMIVTRIMTAYIQADRIYDSTITASYVCRSDILKEYYVWQKNQVKEPQTKIIVKAEEQSEIKPILLGTQPITIIDKDVV